MNRLTQISNQITPFPDEGEISLSYTNTDPSLLKKLKNSIPQLLIPLWVGSPLLALYKLSTGSFDTKLNLLLLLVYQYWFHRKTKILRQMIGTYKAYEFFDGFQVIIEDNEAMLKPSESLFPFHPHGILCTGLNTTAQSHPFFKNAEVVGTQLAGLHPWGGLVMKFYGIEGAYPENFNRLMQEKKNIMFVPGGFEEATITVYGKDRVFVKHRKGFIKLALEYGYTVHPCYVFGETKLYYTATNEKIGLFLNKFKLPGLMAFSKNVVVPNENVKLSVVIGKGIKFPVIPNPTQEYVDKYHSLYVEKLEEMYNRWKGVCGGEDKLEIL